jgi:hypothetical protein
MGAKAMILRAAVAAAVFFAASVGGAQAATGPAASGGPASPPVAFRGIALGMPLDQVKQLLKADPLFRYRGDPDVSFMPPSADPLIACEGTSYISRAWLQFAGGKLAVMELVLDARLVDYYSMFTALSRKYGDPASLDPRGAVWQSAAVRFSLERPLLVKYIDRVTFDAEVARGAAQQDLELLSRDRFIEQF